MSFIINPYRFSAASSFPHTKAISLDWSTEWMANTTTNTIGIADTWTVNIWFNINSFTNANRLLYIHAWTNVNSIQVLTNAADSSVRIVTLDPSSVKIKDYISSNTLSTATNYMYTFTWDGTTLNIYQNASLDGSPTKNDDAAWTMTDTARRIGVWATDSWSEPTDWEICRTDIWNVVLDSANITELYNSWNGYQRDNRNAVWNYDQQAALKHQWALGLNSSNIWADYVSSWGINIWTNASNIDASDIVTF